MALFAFAAACSASPCSGQSAELVVSAALHKLFLCEANGAAQSFPVALGRGGIDKRTQGDDKTPLGVYPLGAARPSGDFHIFIPVFYPTGVQAAKGYSGGDIGVHGPKRRFKALGRMNAWIDWTRGCIAVATDAEIDEIAAWLRSRSVKNIRIING